MKRRSPRYPVQDLMVHARVANNAALARRIGVPRRSLQRTIAEGGFTWISADKAAIACGVHPSVVWPAWMEDSIVWAERWKQRAPDDQLVARRDRIRAEAKAAREARLATAACEDGMAPVRAAL